MLSVYDQTCTTEMLIDYLAAKNLGNHKKKAVLKLL